MTIKLTKTQGDTTVTVEGESHVDVFTNMATAGEVFLSANHHKCGKCGSTDIRYVVRESGKYKFYELRCNNCGAKLTFGVKNDDSGDLFPHRKDDQGNWLPNDGWVKWNAETGKEE